MLVTHSTTFDGDISFNTVSLTISDCVITHIDVPTDPSASGAVTYTIHALNNLNLDLSSPGFVQ